MADSTTQVDLTNCDREPIHIPGTIQPHGCLIACDSNLRVIQRRSANASAYLALGDVELLGRPLEDFFDAEAIHELRNALASAQDPSRAALMTARSVRAGGPLFDIALHRHKGVAIIEFEHVADQRAGPLDLARTMISAAARFGSIEDLLERTPRLLRGLLGYDRVMIYRFAHDGSGEVVGESKRSDLEGFRGQHFPASDIPRQARTLYLQNRIRVISDANCVRVPLEPEYDLSGEPLDLSYAHLRSVSPVHCEYLRNMGVGASMSISIVVDNQLWGLVACHHYGPRTLAMPQRVAAEMFGEYFSLQLEALTRKRKLDTAQEARRALDRVMRDAAYQGDIVNYLQNKLSDLTAFIDCDGVGLWIGGTWTAAGAAPPSKSIPDLVRFAGAAASGKVWATHELGAHLPAADTPTDGVAGVLVVPLSQVPKDYLLFFRREVIQTVNWAGDPNKKYEVGPLGDRLTPRKSFAIWKETVEGQSAPWTDEDREMAEATRTALLEVIMRHSEILASERHTADLRQKVLNEELNHRVKNILSLIKSLVSQPVEQGRDLEEYVASLKGRIMALALAHDQVVRNDGGGALRDLIDAEFSPYRENAANITIDGPATGLDARAYSVLALVLHEMATNAAKYGALSSKEGKLEVRWALDAQGDCEINWTETGGPAVTPPTRRGFGSVLLTRSIPFDLGGESEIEYARDGVKARLLIPSRFLVAIQTTKQKKAPAPRANGKKTPLTGKRALLVEDQLVIALDAEALLTDCGFAEVDTASTSAEALRTLAATTPDIAVLDVNLGSGTSFAVADELERRKIPFIFATGYGDQTMVPQRLKYVPVARKPYDRESLMEALQNALADRGA